MRVVSPYRPFVPESIEHLQVGEFDWRGALAMSRASVEAVYGPQTWRCLTDVDTALDVPTFKYRTTHRRLMLWIVEVCLRYLESEDFDRDTLMLSPDTLLFSKLGKHFKADLGVVVRLGQKFVDSGRVLLNSAQFWRVEAKARLIGFYRRALAIAIELPDNRIRWGADTDPLVNLLAPITSEGVYQRVGLSVNFIDEHRVMEAVTDADMLAIANHDFVRRSPVPITDFRYKRKHFLAEYFNATIGLKCAVSA